jgi:regulator of protease activity HflC (stomatin/prohibitin superfamily)
MLDSHLHLEEPTKELGMEGMGIDLILGILIPLIGTFTAALKAFKFVQEGEKGIKLRFGKATRRRDNTPKVIDPGFVILIPWMETLRRRHVRQQTIRMKDQDVMIMNGLIFRVSAMVMFRVKDVYKAMFEIEGLNSSLEDLSMAILRETLADKKHVDLAKMEAISEELLSALQEKAEEWGVTFLQFKLTDCAPTAETAPLVNAEAGVRLKVAALDKAAEKMGTKTADLPPNLAAALIGVPLVASVTQETNHVHMRPTKG